MSKTKRPRLAALWLVCMTALTAVNAAYVWVQSSAGHFPPLNLVGALVGAAAAGLMLGMWWPNEGEHEDGL